MPDSERMQTGQGSLAALELHVEDAFDDDRCDYVGLIALRNRDKVATTVAGVRIDLLPEDLRQVLREPRFVIARPVQLIGRGAGCSAPSNADLAEPGQPVSGGLPDARIVTLARHLVMGTAINWKTSIY